MKLYQWTPVLLAVALVGCPDKDTGETDTDIGTEDPDTDTDTDSDSDTEADTEPPGPMAGDVVFFEGFETDGTAFPDGWTTTDTGDVNWKLCPVGEACPDSSGSPNSGAQLAHASGDWYAAIDADGDGSSSATELYSGTLTSPAIDLSEYGDFGIELTLSEWFRDYSSSSDDMASIEVSTDSGATWTVIEPYTDSEGDPMGSVNGPCPATYDFSAYAGTSVQMRFNYVGGWDYWFMVDNIALTLTDGAPEVPEGNAWDCPPEICDNGLDEDLDIFEDCFDADCAEDPACDGVCVAEEVTLPSSGMGSTPLDMTSNLDWASGPDCSTGAGPELVFSVDAVAGDIIAVRELSSSFDAVVRIVDGCDAGTSTCLASVDSGDAVDYEVVTDGTYTVVIEAYSASEMDDFEYVVGLNPAETEVCGGGGDADLDGAVDCDDVDCLTDAACPYECPADTPVTFPFTETADISTLDAPLPYGEGDNCGAASGVGRIYQAVVPAGQQLRVVESSSEDVVLRVLQDCTPTTECLASTNTPEEIRYQAGDAEETVYFVMEASSAFNTSGEYTLTADILPPEDCSTDSDEDDDGDAGCDDSDCALDVACFELDCTDGVSGDDDDLIDCMDPDCDQSEDCVETICDDGIDNEGDGLTDCDDPQCVGTSVCPEVDCEDGLDNDVDGAIDCADSDCADFEICYECPAPIATPFQIQGTAFSDENPDVFDFGSGGGCATSGGGDVIRAVNLLAGQVVTVLPDEGGDFDAKLNVVKAADGGCAPAQTDDTCVYGQDDPNVYVYTADEDGLYYLHFTAFSATYNSDYSYTVSVMDDVCPDVSSPGDFPMTLSGTNWRFRGDLVDFAGTGGCEDGSSGGGADFLFAVDMAIGDTVTTTENSGGVDYIWNVTAGDCTPEGTGNTCLDSSDDDPSDGDYSYTAVAPGVHYFHLSSYSNSDTSSYNITIDFTPAAP